MILTEIFLFYLFFKYFGSDEFFVSRIGYAGLLRIFLPFNIRGYMSVSKLLNLSRANAEKGSKGPTPHSFFVLLNKISLWELWIDQLHHVFVNSSSIRVFENAKCGVFRNVLQGRFGD